MRLALAADVLLHHRINDPVGYQLIEVGLAQRTKLLVQFGDAGVAEGVPAWT